MPSMKGIVFRIIVIVAAIELLIMLSFSYVFPPMPSLIETLLDVTLLSSIITPLIYLFIIKPYMIANKQLIDKINSLAFHDQLTSLLNRRALYDHLTELLSDQHRLKYGALLFIDLDDLKVMNDRFGHNAGNAALFTAAKRLTKAIRAKDIAYRIGGDEFIVLLNCCENDKLSAERTALTIAQKILDNIKKPIKFEHQELYAGVSIGIKILCPGRLSFEKALEGADAAMYAAKKSKAKIVVAA